MKMILSEDHSVTPIAAGSLAAIYTSQGWLREADKLVSEKAKILDNDLPGELFINRNNVVETYREHGRMMQAAELHEKVQAKRKTIFNNTRS